MTGPPQSNDFQPRLPAQQRRQAPGAAVFVEPRASGAGPARRPGRHENRTRASWARGPWRGGRWRGRGAGQPECGDGRGVGSDQPIRRTVPPRGMTLGPMGRTLHSVNAVGGGSEKMRAGWESGQDGECPREGKREREKFLRRTRGMCWLECILHGPKLLRDSAPCLWVSCHSSRRGTQSPGYQSPRFQRFQKGWLSRSTLVHLSMLSPSASSFIIAQLRSPYDGMKRGSLPCMCACIYMLGKAK